MSDRNSTPSPDDAADPFDLFNLPPEQGSTDEALSLTDRFEQFHDRNPAFYDAIVKLARRFRDKTGRTCGIQRLIEIARFDIEMTTVSDDEFKVNNDFASYYSRLIMFREPDLAGFFNVRSAPEADQWIAILRHTGRAA